jgi:D-glycero-D-manno-heptose 1,7-bisphosphate phosphatase
VGLSIRGRIGRAWRPRQGLWQELAPRRGTRGRGTPARGRPALFLDRDGVLLADPGYLHRAADTRLLPGVARALRPLARRGWALVVVTNQSGIGRGFYDWRAFVALQDWLARRLARQGVRLDAVLACPLHPEGRPPYRRAHAARKPGPGMLLAAASALGLDLGRSWILGDRVSDLAAGRAAGLAGGLLLGGAGAEQGRALALARADFAVRLAGRLERVPGLIAGAERPEGDLEAGD